MTVINYLIHLLNMILMLHNVFIILRLYIPSIILIVFTWKQWNVYLQRLLKSCMQYLRIKSFFSYWFLQMLHRTNDLIFVDKVFLTNETSSATNIVKWNMFIWCYGICICTFILFLVFVITRRLTFSASSTTIMPFLTTKLCKNNPWEKGIQVN